MTSALKRPHRILAVLIAALFAAGPVAADRGDKADKQAQKAEKKADKRGMQGHGDVRIGAYFSDQHRRAARSYYSQNYGSARDCPPGLAKKNDACMPAGQAKKFRAGEPLPAGVAVYPVPQPVLVQLPPPPAGYRYVRVDNDIALVQVQNNIVIDVIQNLFG